MQRFGHQLHLRVAPGEAAAVIGRLRAAVAADGARITRLEEIEPQLEDVFIALAEG